MSKRAVAGVVAAGFLVYAGSALVAGGAAEAASVATVQAESMTSVQGYGASVVSDAAASAGKALLVDSNVSVQKSVTLSGAASSLVVRAHTDGSAASMTVAVDGVVFPATSVPALSWASYSFSRVLASGTHVVRVSFTNACCRNLFLDMLSFEGAVVPSPSVTPSGTSVSAYLTGYSYYDNDPPGSADICCPTVHSSAAGTGTYADPITLAVGWSGTATYDWPIGTRFYIPVLKRYFVVEDSCAACHSGARPAGSSTWVDAWVGGGDVTNAAADACMNKITGVHTIIRNPPSGYVVVAGPIVSASGCTALYGETPVLA